MVDISQNKISTSTVNDKFNENPTVETDWDGNAESRSKNLVQYVSQDKTSTSTINEKFNRIPTVKRDGHDNAANEELNLTIL